MSDTALSLVDRWLFPGWVIFAVVNTALMFAVPGQETIPFHFVYISMGRIQPAPPWSGTSRTTSSDGKRRPRFR